MSTTVGPSSRTSPARAAERTAAEEPRRLDWLTAGGTAPADDQRRIATPAATLAAGGSHVVIARAIITRPDPAQAVYLTGQEVAAPAGRSPSSPRAGS